MPRSGGGTIRDEARRLRMFHSDRADPNDRNVLEHENVRERSNPERPLVEPVTPSCRKAL